MRPDVVIPAPSAPVFRILLVGLGAADVHLWQSRFGDAVRAAGWPEVRVVESGASGGAAPPSGASAVPAPRDWLNFTGHVLSAGDLSARVWAWRSAALSAQVGSVAATLLTGASSPGFMVLSFLASSWASCPWLFVSCEARGDLTASLLFPGDGGFAAAGWDAALLGGEVRLSLALPFVEELAGPAARAQAFRLLRATDPERVLLVTRSGVALVRRF